MPATLPANTTTHVAGIRTRGLWLLQIDFATPLRLCTREEVSWNSLTWSSASFPAFEVTLDGLLGRFDLINDAFAYTQFISEQASGLVASVWELFGDEPFAVGDARQIFVGELGAGNLTEDGHVVFGLRQPERRFAPRQRITAADFNHLQIAGTRYSTPNGIVELGNA